MQVTLVGLYPLISKPELLAHLVSFEISGVPKVMSKNNCTISLSIHFLSILIFIHTNMRCFKYLLQHDKPVLFLSSEENQGCLEFVVSNSWYYCCCFVSCVIILRTNVIVFTFLTFLGNLCTQLYLNTVLCFKINKKLHHKVKEIKIHKSISLL